MYATFVARTTFPLPTARRLRHNSTFQVPREFFFFPEVFSVPSGAKLLPHFESSSRTRDDSRSIRCFLPFCAQTRRGGLLLTKPACDGTLEKGSHPHPRPSLPNRGIVCPRPIVATNYDSWHIGTPVYKAHKAQRFLRHSVLSGSMDHANELWLCMPRRRSLSAQKWDKHVSVDMDAYRATSWVALNLPRRSASDHLEYSRAADMWKM